MQPQQNNSIKILEYRNGIYQGQVKGNKRHGQGILITDQNTIIVSDWKNDLMSGKGLVIFNPDHYGFGQFNRGEIQGGFLFRNKSKTLFSEFNLSRPINKMVLINYETNQLQIVAHKTPIYQILGEKKLEYDNETQEIFQAINIKFPSYSLLDFIQQELCKLNDRKKQNVLQKATSTTFLDEHGQEKQNFKQKLLNNGNILFYYDDPTNPTCLGFCLNKNEQIVSWGMYVNDKLSGLGCKYENTVRYEGMFQSGFVNGIGLKLSQGKYSFGQFQNGNLIEALYIQDRSNISEQKLQEFKKLQHIRSMWHENAFIRRNLIKFKGVNQLIFEINSQQEYMYPQLITSLISGKKINSNTNKQTNQQYIQINKSNSKNQNQDNNYNTNTSNISNSRNLALNMLLKRQGDKLETKSSKQFFVRPNTINSIKNQTNSYFNPVTSPGNANQSINMNKNKNIFVANNNGRMNSVDYDVDHEDEDDTLSQGQRSTNGLRNLRKYKY